MDKVKESKIMNFISFIKEGYEYENFTHSDMEFVKDLYNDGMTDVNDIARECEGVFSNNCTGDECVDMVKQILHSIKKSEPKKKNICISCDDCDCECCRK